MMRLKSDLVDVMLAATDAKLDQVELQWDRRTALGVVMAAAGYPEDPRKGDAISGLPQDAADAMVFHAGTQLRMAFPSPAVAAYCASPCWPTASSRPSKGL